MRAQKRMARGEGAMVQRQVCERLRTWGMR